MWSVSYDNLFIGVVMVLVAGYLVAQCVFRINAASFFEARRLARRGLDSDQTVRPRARSSNHRWQSQHPEVRFRTVIRVRPEGSRRKVNPR